MRCPTCGSTYRRVSGEGTSYADNMFAPSNTHRKILTTLIDSPNKRYLKKEIYDLVNMRFPSNYLTIHASISQLVRKGVLEMKRLPKIKVHTDRSITTVKKPLYLLNREYAIKVLRNERY